jgi:hypothetical protein
MVIVCNTVLVQLSGNPLEGAFCFLNRLLDDPTGISNFLTFSIQSEIKVLMILSENWVNVSRKFGS